MDNEITINGEIYVKKAVLIPTAYNIARESLMNKKEKKPWPQEGDEYFYIGTCGSVTSEVYNGLESSRERKKFGNFFRTKEEAEMYSFRIENLSKGFMPNGKYWMWNFVRKIPDEFHGDGVLYINPKFPTKEECQEWGIWQELGVPFN